MAVHALASLTWTEVQGLAGPRTLAILPTGAIEAHGPHLPIGTDVIIAQAMADAGAVRLGARGYTVLLLPPLSFAPAPFASGFPGTIHVAAEATTLTVGGIARSLAAHGISVTAIANAHHDPTHVQALRTAVAQITGQQQATVVFPDLTKRRWAERLTDEFRGGACHAGRYEGSIVLAADAAHVKRDVMTTLLANPRSIVDAIKRGVGTFEAAGGPDAYFGAPAEATVEEGRAIIETLGAILEEAVAEVMERR